jgi:Uncharacterised nucleotidyltransferase
MENTTNFNQSDKYQVDLEFKLMRACISLDQRRDKRIYEILDITINWSRFYILSTQHGIFPICCKQLLSLKDAHLPPEAILKWEEAFETNTQNNLRLSWKLIHCLELLSKNGIESIVLKGPVFAIQIYRDITLRQFSDLDILIHQTDFSKVYEILLQSGYIPSIKLDNNQRNFLIRSDNHFSFYRQEDILEVHWDIGPKENVHPLAPEQLWIEVNYVHLYEKDIWTLSPENTILFICLHGAKHGWNQLKWIVDLAYLYQSISDDTLLEILARVKLNGFYRQVCLGLLLAENLVDARLPSKVHVIIESDPHAKFLASRVMANIINDTFTTSPISNYWFYLQTRERWQDRLHYIIDILFVPKTPDWLAISLPDKLYFLYYLIRPFRLLYHAGKSAITARN